MFLNISMCIAAVYGGDVGEYFVIRSALADIASVMV